MLPRQIVVQNRPPEPDWLQNGPAHVYTRRIYWNSPPFPTTAATTGNIDLTGFPGALTILGAWIVFTQNWTGGAISAVTMSIGTTGSPAAYVAATSVFSGATPVTTPVAIPGVSTLAPGTFLATPPQALGTVRVQLLTTTANVNALTAGRADIYLRLLAVSVNVK